MRVSAWMLGLGLGLGAPAGAAEPFPAQTDAGVLAVTAYGLPPSDPAWLEDEAPTHRCVVELVHHPGQPAEAEATDCPGPMTEDFLAATRAWLVEGPAARIAIHYVVKYNPVVQAMTVHARVDPGREAAEAGVEGPPGVKLVHPAVPTRRVIPRRLPAKLRRAGIQGLRCDLHFWLDARGRVAEVQVQGCDPRMHRRMARAAGRWRFSPRYVDGLPVPVELLESVEIGRPPPEQDDT